MNAPQKKKAKVFFILSFGCVGCLYFLPVESWIVLSNMSMLGSKDLGFYVFRTLICIVGKP